MACKPCQKNQRRPLSPAAVRQRQEERREEQQRNAPHSPAKKGSDQEGTTRTASFVLQTIDGRTQAFGSRLEADAARVRAGGGTIRRF